MAKKRMATAGEAAAALKMLEGKQGDAPRALKMCPIMSGAVMPGSGASANRLDIPGMQAPVQNVQVSKVACFGPGGCEMWNSCHLGEIISAIAGKLIVAQEEKAK